MQKHYRSWTTAVACCLLAACIGCNGTTPDEPPNGPDNGAEPGDPGAEPTGGNGATPAAEPAPPPTVPEVALMEADRAKCKVQVDDAMPAGELSDLAGQVHSLPALYGAKLTVIHLWQSGATAFSAMAAEDALEFLAKDVAEPFAEQGVAVLASTWAIRPRPPKSIWKRPRRSSPTSSTPTGFTSPRSPRKNYPEPT